MCPEDGVRRRRSLRFDGYDYSLEGAYFVTMITHQRECLFGEVINGDVVLSQFGEVVNSNYMKMSLWSCPIMSMASFALFKMTMKPLTQLVIQ
jgi:hypothetical protein